MRCRITVQCDGPWQRSLHFDRLAEERLGCSDIAPGAEPKVYCLPIAIDRPVQIDPLAADFHVGLVDAPRRTYRPRELVPATLELRNIMMHPTHNGGVGHRQAALGHHLHQIPETELEAQVPPHAQDDDLAIKVPTTKQLVHARKPGHRTALNSPEGYEATTAGNLHQSRITVTATALTVSLETVAAV